MTPTGVKMAVRASKTCYTKTELKVTYYANCKTDLFSAN